MSTIARGDRMLLLRAALVGLCSLAVLLACANSALATRPYEFKAAFGSKCLAQPCTGESLQKPAGVAVNEETGDLYVVDEGEAGQHGRVVRFSEAGAFLSEFNGSGTLPGEEHAAGSLKRAGEVETGRFEEPQTIAVDNSCLLRKLTKVECEEKDPSNGDVYVVDAGISHRVVDKYSPSGEYLGQISEGEEGGVKKRFARALDGVAVDTKGGVWVYQETRVLQHYDDKTPNAFLEAKGISLPCCGLPGFAIDASGGFYLRLILGANRRIAKLDPSAKVIKEEVLKEGSNSVAANQVNSNALIDNDTSVAVLEPTGEVIERLGEGHLSEAAGIGMNAAAGSFYVGEDAAAATDALAAFGPAEPAAPRVERESFANVSAGEASLEAQINPRSEEGEAPTQWRFAYGRCQSATSCAESGYEASVPATPGQIQADFEAHTVSAKLEGLQANTTYHFRALASNSHGEGQGAEVQLRTQTEGGELVLPDQRAFELVSPPDKQGALIEPIAETGVVQAAASGDGVTYLANAPTEAEPQGNNNHVQVLSRRSSNAWSSRDIAIPHSGPTGVAIGPGSEYKLFDPELTLSAVQPFGEFIPALSEEASESTAYLHDLTEACASHCYRPLVTRANDTASPFVPFGEAELCIASETRKSKVACGPEFLGASADLAHIVLRSSAALAEGAIGGELYEWSGGRLAQVSVLPGGEPAPVESELGNARQGSARGAISSDGARIVWSTPGATPEALYLRDMGRGETVQLDKAEEVEGAPCEECESGGGQFQLASADGSRVLFTDTRKLTEDAGAEAVKGRADLYECEVVLRAGKLACALFDLTPKGAGPAEVQGSVLGASEDASWVYFVAKGALSEAANARGQRALAGQPNLYLRHGGTTRFIATLAPGDEADWGKLGFLRSQPTRVSASGRYLALMSEAAPTGYDNRDVATGEPVAEVYLYDAESGKLACASCEPSGARPVGVEYEKLMPGNGGLAGGPRDIWPAQALVAANVPGWTTITSGHAKSRYQPRYLSDAGRLFFNSADALVTQDTNNTEDVYEYEPPGVGSCSEAAESFSARAGGCVSLISSGTSAQESAFLDASESGDDVFFLTSARLSPLDSDSARDVYDAHVCSAEAPCITYAPAPSPPCASESACKAPASPLPQIFGAPPSATAQSTGNLAPKPPAPAPRESAEQRRLKNLAKALRACRAKKNKRKRKSCEAQARKRYAKPKPKGKAKGHKARPARGRAHR